MTEFLALDIAGHLCETALVLGMFAIAKGHSAGWLLRLAGSIGWICIAVLLAFEGVLLTSLIVWPLLFASIDLYGWNKWREE